MKCSTSIRLAMVTGVSKFCHVSLFSELNNLTDIRGWWNQVLITL